MVPCQFDQHVAGFIRLENDVGRRINDAAPQSRQGKNMTEKTSQVAIVTGASRGIGAAIAERLASDGLTVTINYSGDVKSAEAVAAAAFPSNHWGLREHQFDAEMNRADI